MTPRLPNLLCQPVANFAARSAVRDLGPTRQAGLSASVFRMGQELPNAPRCFALAGEKHEVDGCAYIG